MRAHAHLVLTQGVVAVLERRVAQHAVDVHAAGILQRLAETAACFANAQGGTIIVGVADPSSGHDAFVGHTLDAARTARRIYELTEPALTTIVEDITYASHTLLTAGTTTGRDTTATSR